MKIIKLLSLLSILLILSSCEEKEPNHDKKDTVGDTYTVGDSKSMNVYEIEYEGYKLLLLKEIYNSNGRENYVGVILNPKYEQPPIYKITTIIDTIATLNIHEPVSIDLNKPVNIKVENND